MGNGGAALKKVGKLNANTDAAFKALQEKLRGAFQSVDGRMALLADVVDALADLVGRDMVAKTVARLRREREDEALIKAIDEGQLVAATTVSSKSLVSGRETGADGKTQSTRLPVALMAPDVQKELLGKCVGDSVDSRNGATFTIENIYEPAEHVTQPA